MRRGIWGGEQLGQKEGGNGEGDNVRRRWRGGQWGRGQDGKGAMGIGKGERDGDEEKKEQAEGRFHRWI